MFAIVLVLFGIRTPTKTHLALGYDVLITIGAPTSMQTGPRAPGWGSPWPSGRLPKSQDLGRGGYDGSGAGILDFQSPNTRKWKVSACWGV